jgi:CsoR family transcriptional regulator, copper-sensing transcriptional repressor
MAEETRTLSPSTRDDVLLRLRRIEGQVRGVQRMVEEARDCREIVNQVAAIKAALVSVNAAVLQCYAHNCLDSNSESPNPQVAELIEVMIKGTK